MGRYIKCFNASILTRYIKEGRGAGEGDSYNPWIHIYDLPSKGLSSIVPGWKTNREHHILSNLELYFFYLAEWSRKIIDIREQFPLIAIDSKLAPLEETLAIAAERKIRHPQDPQTKHPIALTTDFLLTLEIDGKRFYHARTIKKAQDLTNRRVIEKFEIERRYWLAHKVDWGIVTERDIPMTIVKNIDILHQSYFLPNFVEREGLIDTAQVLTTIIREENSISLTDVTKSCDQRLGIKRGSSLAVAYYLIATRQWRIDIQKLLNPAVPLHVLSVSLQDS